MAPGEDSGDDPDGATADVVLRLPDRNRSAFKDPMGPVTTDTDELLAEAGDPLVAVGDVVTYHLREAGRNPDLAVVDGMTERERASPEVRTVAVDGSPEVSNPAATLTTDLLVAIREGLAADAPRTVVVDGEEDLATLPAVLAAPGGASVVYGQPGEGMVHVRVTAGAKDRIRRLLDELEGDHDRALAALGLES